MGHRARRTLASPLERLELVGQCLEPLGEPSWRTVPLLGLDREAHLLPFFAGDDPIVVPINLVKRELSGARPHPPRRQGGPSRLLASDEILQLLLGILDLGAAIREFRRMTFYTKNNNFPRL